MKGKKWISFIVLTLTAGIIYKVPYIKTVFYNPMMESLNLTNVQIGALMSVYSLTKTVIYIPGGILADRFDNRKMLAGSMAIQTLLTFWFAAMPSYGSLKIIYFSLAFTNVIFWVSFVKALRIFGSEKEQGSIFGYSEGIRAVSGLLINFAALAILDRYVSSQQSMRNILILYGISYGIMSIAIWFLLPKEDKSSNTTATSFKDYVDALKIPGVWLVAFMVMAAYCVQVASEYTTPYLTTVFGMSSVMAGIIANVRSYGIGIFSAPIIGKISDKVSSYVKMVIILFAAEIVAAVFLLIVPEGQNYLTIGIVAVLAIATVMYAMRGVYYATMGEAGVPIAMTGTATGIISVVGYLPDAFMNVMLGGFLDKYEGVLGYKYVFGSMIVSAVVGILISYAIIVLNRKKQKLVQ